MFYICGDFKVISMSGARVSKIFITAADNIPDRDVIDFSSNKYGEVLL